ncbi:extracellular solute-binding protein [Halocynthiibacter sp. C4]|uniref:ABC transporter substrate-binding protein n=1 Tax=Halocynthiibacter sp. C4 TaxID=2992758 RepID=UPI00237AC27E|nr:extracellular solute-binding protein [Halocynthiibacter sp. C4]MDE0591484.1 extracellular solute-binding protein [Halocynthiibacter sp. C4]
MKFFNNMTAASLAAVVSVGAVQAADLKMVVDKQTWMEGIQAMASDAGAASGQTIEAELVTPSDKYQAFIQTSIAGGNTPTFFSWWNGSQLTDLVATGAAADLSAQWDAAIANGDFSSAQRDLVSVDGKPYAFLLNQASWVTFYNMEAFEKAGISGTPTTWAEFLDACEKLKAAGYTPINAPGTEWMPFIWFSQLVAGVDPDAFVGINDGSVAYNGEAVQQAFDMWVEMYDKGYFSDPREKDDQKFFVEGSAAMYLTGDWHTGSFVASGMEPGKQLGTFLTPPVNDDAGLSVIIEAAPVIVSSAALAENPGVGDAVQAMMTADASNTLGSIAGVYNGNLQASTPNAIIEGNMFEIGERQPRGLVRWWEAVPPQIQGDLVAAMGEFMLNPTADQAQDTMTLMNAISADYWANN